MQNPMFNQMNGGANPGGNNMGNQFMNFMKQMRGKDPNTMLNEIVSSGKISQQQLNMVQQQYQQMRGFFDQFKNMFNFM